MVRKHLIAKSPVRNIMKQNNARIVAADALNTFVEWIEGEAARVTKSALTLAHHAHRKKITKDDIKLAIGF